MRFTIRSQSYQTLISSFYRFLFLSLVILKYRQYFCMLQTLRLNNKKRKKIFVLQRKKFGRIDSHFSIPTLHYICTVEIIYFITKIIMAYWFHNIACFLICFFSLTCEWNWCQFQQHFTCSFFIRKFRGKLFCAYILGLNFFWRKNFGANVLIKCWWNWLLVSKILKISALSIETFGLTSFFTVEIELRLSD